MKAHRPMQARNVFEWLDQVRSRPGMWFVGLVELESLSGYETALAVHDIDEEVPAMRHFGAWVEVMRGWSLSRGWARALEEHASARTDSTQLFFDLVTDYRRLRPKLRVRVRLRAFHRPTGKRVSIGLDGGVYAKPRAIEVWQLSPARLHHLRFIYPECRVDHRVTFATLASAKRWVQDEFLVKPADWARPDRSRR